MKSKIFGNFEAKSFKINKGKVQLLKQMQQCSIEYPEAMEGHINIQEVGENVEVILDKEFPNEPPIKINLNALQNCNVLLENGVLESSYVCPKMLVKVNNGTLSAKINSGEVKSVVAKVGTGLLNNYTNLNSKPINDEIVNNQNNWGFGENFGINFNIQAFNSSKKVELIGNGENEVVFEVSNGIMELN